jgi:ATP-dependent Clp protease ATP-binding subunit ClpC
MHEYDDGYFLLQRFDPVAVAIVHDALQLAFRHHHVQLGTEHLLVSLLARLAETPEAMAIRLLQALHVEPSALRARIEPYVDANQVGDEGTTPYWAESTKTAIDLAIDEAHRVNLGYVGAEHFLLGFVREKESAAARVLRDAGVMYTRAQSELHSLLRRSMGDGAQSPLIG